MKTNATKKFFTLFFLVPIFLLSGCGKKQTETPYQVNLEMWGLFDDSSVFSDAISKYGSVNSHSKIIYKKKEEATYREDLLRAFAAGNAPDVFLIRNSWYSDFQDFIEPAPSGIVSEKEIHDAFVETVVRDSYVDGKLYGVPLSVDSLALYYNKDLFNAAGIITTPSTWDELASYAKRFTEIDINGDIIRSGVALGTAGNVNRASDVLLAIAFQRGMTTTSKGFTDAFNISGNEMQGALQFLSQFASVGSEYYTWNSRLHYSIDSFYEGKLAMMINYSWKIDEIKRKNPKLNFAVAPLPQVNPEKPVNYSNYWVFVVAKKKDLKETEKGFSSAEQYNKARIYESWQFLRYLAFPNPTKQLVLRNALDGIVRTVALDFDPAKTYVETGKKPAARKDLVGTQQQNDPWLSPFAYGNLLAKSWRQPELERAEVILNSAIDSVARGESTSQDALSFAASQIGLLGKMKSR